MKNAINNFFKISFILLLASSCNFEAPEQTAEINANLNALSIPDGFDFSTHQKVTINIIESADYAKYDVFAYSNAMGETPTEADLSGNLIFTGIPNNGVLSQTINLPKYHTKVYIRRNEGINTSLTSKDIVNQEVNFNSSEAKNTIKLIANKNAANIDTDRDGVLDEDDDYPEDRELAFRLSIPNTSGVGTIAFEDLWPSTGDYDFNDVAFAYRTTLYLNANNLVVGFDFKYRITSNNTTGINGIGFQMDNLIPSQIEKVTTPLLTRNFINLNANGTEANQENAVIILSDDIRNIEHGGEHVQFGWHYKDLYNFESKTISVKFVNPVSTNDLGVAPFNPFLILNIDSRYSQYMNPRNPRYPEGMVRKYELHLPYMKTTSLGSPLLNTKDHTSNYMAENGYPWGIHVIDNFRVPKPIIAITDAYNFFGAWAESGGTEFQNWYTDEAGNRNQSLLK